MYITFLKKTFFKTKNLGVRLENYNGQNINNATYFYLLQIIKNYIIVEFDKTLKCIMQHDYSN